ncbi:MAG: hypothetical protein Kow0037_21280 [Calditrichia bacterium]
MRQLIVLLLLLFSLGCKKAIETHQLPAVSVDSLQSYMNVLTSDSLEGREAGQTGGVKAAKYLAAFLEKYGIMPAGNPEARGLRAYYQTFRILEASDHDVKAQIVLSGNDLKAIDLVQNEDFYCFWEAQPKPAITGKVHFVGFGIEAPEYRYGDIPADTAGAEIALVFYGEPEVPGMEDFFWGKHRTNYSDTRIKAQSLSEKGYKALFVVPFPGKEKAYQRMLSRRLKSSARKRSVLAETDTIPIIYFSREAGQKLFGIDSLHFNNEQTRLAEWARGKRNGPFKWHLPEPGRKLSAKIQFAEIPFTETVCRNVLGVIPGRDKSLAKEVILVGSHYDHEGIVNGKIHRGADDNASGVVANMNIARILNRLPDSEKPKRTIVFAFWDAEEKGMLGSRYFLGSANARQWRIRMAFNMDMIGRDASFNFAALRKPVVEEDAENKVMMFYSAQAPELAVIGKALNRWTNLQLLLDPNVYFTSGSDHALFHFHRIPVVYYFTGFHMDYSSPADVPEKINFEKLAKITHHILLFVDYLGSADRVPGFNPEILVAPEGDFKM